MLHDLLRHPRLPLAAAALAVVLTLPALFVGYQADDWFHLAELRGVMPVGEPRAPEDALFSFFDGDPARTAQLRDAGIVPWWVDLHLRAAFWRPVTVATHRLDEALAPGSAAAAHAQSIGWFALLVVLAGALYRRVHPAEGGRASAVGGLALLLYAVDEAHGLPVGWLANRNALVSGCLGFGVILLYDRWRRDGAAWAAVAAPAVFALALFSAESGLAATAWLFAHALFLDRGPRARRLLRLAPYAALVVVWRVVYSARGFGTEGSGLYLDPVRQPLRYAAALVERVPQLLADQLLNVPSMFQSFLPAGIRLPLAAALAGAVGAFAWVLWRELRGSRTAAFWTVGMLLSVLPVAATFPAPRLLTFVGLGGAALLAEFVVSALGREGGPRRLAWTVVAVHGVLAAVSLPAQTWMVKPLTEALFGCEPLAAAGPGAGDSTAIFVNANDLCVGYVPITRAVRGEPSPRVLLLASALYDVTVVGIDHHTLEVRIPQGMQSNPADSLLRSARDPLPVGTTVAIAAATLRVQSHNDAGLVDAVRVRFVRPLGDPQHQWLCTIDGVGQACAPPAPGESLVLPSVFARFRGDADLPPGPTAAGGLQSPP